MNNSKEVIKLISDLRKEKKMSIDELAKRVGIAKSTLSRYESGQRDFPINDIGKYAQVLNVSIEYLLGLNKIGVSNIDEYSYLPTAISAGLPINVDGITNDQVEKISLPDSVMGKWAGKKDIFITKINGDSMDKIMPHGSLIAVKPVTLDELKDGDMVVFSDNYDYSVKCFYQDEKRLIFRPESYNKKHTDQIYSANDNIQIHGKVVLYIVERD